MAGFDDLIQKAIKAIGDRVKKGNCLVLVIATYAVGALLLKYFIDWSDINTGIVKKINFFPIKDKKWRKRFEYWRGDNYALVTHDLNGNKIPKSRAQTTTTQQPFYLMTGWACLHVLLYAVLGFIAPQYWWIMMMMTVVWELYEFAGDHDYHDLMDVGWNTTGLLFGIGLRKLILKQ